MKVSMYHYVRNSKENMPNFRYLSVENFCKQLDYFEEEYGIVTYDEFADFMQDESKYEAIKDKVLLSFDDGFTDHFDYVFPELKRRGIFGLFYIPTGVYEKHKALDVHRIHFLLGRFGGQELVERIENKLTECMLADKHRDEFKTMTYIDQDNDFYTQEFKKIFNYYISYEYRENLLDDLVNELSSDEEIFQEMYMSVEQLKQMHNEKMVIGSHSINHYVFSKLSDVDQKKEIYESFGFIEKNLGKLKIKTFCYPYGGFHSFTDYTEQLLDEVGCQFSLNVEHRDMDLKDYQDRPQALPRYDCNVFPFGKANLG